MKIETFFEKFELFADAPGAVGKMRELVLDFAISGKLIPSESEWPNRPLKSLSTKIGSGATPKGGRESYFSEGVPLIRSMNVHFRGFEPTGLVYLSDEQADLLSNVIVQQNDVLLNITGASIGRVTIAPAEMDGARVNQHVTIIRSNKELLPRFLALFLASPSIQRMINEVQVGATRQALTKGMIEKFEIPLPPVAEQKRIVAKVDELMALYDRLEEQQQEREARHAALVRASLARFSDAPTPANLNFLFHPSYTISPVDLRKSILTLAVQGDLSAGSSDPTEWSAVTMKDVCDLITDGEHATPQRVPSGVPLATAKNVRDGFLDMTQTDFVASETAEKCWKRCKPHHGDILMVCVGATTGRVCLVTNPPDMVLVRSVALLRPNTKRIEATFLDLFLRSPSGQSQIWSGVRQNAQPCLYLGKMSEFMIQLPPLSEQRRIVAKVDQLMALVDALETQLAASRATAANLLSALVAELTDTLAGRVACPAPVKPIAGSPRPNPQQEAVATAKPVTQDATVSHKTLTDLRKAAGLTQAAVAEALGLNQAYISQMETGKRSITVEQREKMFKIFGLMPK